MPAHGVRQHRKGCGSPQLVEAGHHRREVGQIVLDLDHVAALAMCRKRSEPPWPRQSRIAAAKPSAASSSSVSRVLLDELGAPGQHDDGAARPARLPARDGRRAPACPSTATCSSVERQRARRLPAAVIGANRGGVHAPPRSRSARRATVRPRARSVNRRRPRGWRRAAAAGPRPQQHDGDAPVARIVGDRRTSGSASPLPTTSAMRPGPARLRPSTSRVALARSAER